MPTLTLPLTAEGLAVVDVRISLRPSRVQALLRASQQAPPPLAGAGILDTGTSVTCIDPGVRQPLGLTPVGTVPISSAASPAPVICNLYKAELRIVHPSGNSQHDLVWSMAPMVETQVAHLGAQVLVGCDVLGQCLFVYNGRGGTFTLDY